MIVLLLYYIFSTLEILTNLNKYLKYFLNIQENPSDDWFVKNASPEILKKMFDNLPEESKQSAIEELIDNLDF